IAFPTSLLARARPRCTMQRAMGNSSSPPKYGPGNTVVGEPLFPRDSGFSGVAAQAADSAAEEPAPSTAPSTHPMPAPPAGAAASRPTNRAEETAAEAITAEAYGYGSSPNLSAGYPPAPAPERAPGAGFATGNSLVAYPPVYVPAPSYLQAAGVPPP